MRSYLSRFSLKEALLPLKFPVPKQTLRLVRSNFANVNLMKGILGLARTVAEWVFMCFCMQSSGYLAKDVNYFGDFSLLLSDLMATKRCCLAIK